MATGRDVLMQCLQEVRELQQQVQEGEERSAQQLTLVKEDVGELQKNVKTLAENVSTLADNADKTRLSHERYFNKIGRVLNMLAEQQLNTQGTMDDHEHRLRLLEKR